LSSRGNQTVKHQTRGRERSGKRVKTNARRKALRKKQPHKSEIDFFKVGETRGKQKGGNELGGRGVKGSGWDT